MKVQRAHPGPSALVNPVDRDDLAVADVIADWKSWAGPEARGRLTTARRASPGYLVDMAGAAVAGGAVGVTPGSPLGA